MYAGLIAGFLGYAWLTRFGAPGRARALYFGLGLLAVWAGLLTPVDTIGDQYLQSAHMLQHILIGVVAPPLLLLGLSEPMARTVLRLPGLRLATSLVPAQLIGGGVMLFWHIPLLYNATLASDPVHILEHLSLIGGGLVFWWPVIGATSAASGVALPAGLKIVYLLAGTFAQDVVSLVLMFSRTVFYPYYEHVPRLVPGLDPLTDQTISGTLLMFAGKVSYAWAMLAITFRWFGNGEEPPEEEPGGEEAPPRVSQAAAR